MTPDLEGMDMPSFGNGPQGGQTDSGLGGGMGGDGGGELSMDNLDKESGEEGPDTDGSFGPDENGNNGAEDENYGNDFDAGVEADEEEDPEKYLQQLTGKLCAKLKKYNDEKPEPDAGMCKYIAGMVLAQCTKGLDGKEKDEILSKLTKGGDKHDDESDEDDSFDDSRDDEDSMDYGEDDGGEMNESRKILERVIQNVKNDISDKKPKGQTNKRRSYKTKPYETPLFR